MKRATRDQAVVRYTVPPIPDVEALAGVRAKRDAYVKAGDKFETARETLRDAKALIDDAKRADRTAVAQASLAGKKLPKPNAHELEAVATVERLSQVLDGLDEACRLAGDELVDEIARAKADWIAELERDAEAANAEFSEAVAVIRSADNRLALAGSAVRWLRGFNAGAAKVGQAGQYPGKPSASLPLPHRLTVEAKVSDALTALAKALNPEKPAPRVIDQPSATRFGR